MYRRSSVAVQNSAVFVLVILGFGVVGETSEGNILFEQQRDIRKNSNM